MASSILSFSLLLITVYTADGWMFYTVDRCVFNSTELNDIEFISSQYYNKLEFTRFSSNVGKFVGYTEFGIKTADYWNHNPAQLAQMKAQKEMYCQHNIKLYYEAALNRSVKPYVRLDSVEPPVGEDPAMLVCSVYDFYPKQITVSWIRDGQEVTSGVTSTEELADGDWYYQTHSYLEYTPRSGEKISCVVDHASMKQPLVTDWDPPTPDSDMNMIIIIASDLMLALVLVLAGFLIYCWRKTRDQSYKKLIENQYSPGWIVGPTKCKPDSGKLCTVSDR